MFDNETIKKVKESNPGQKLYAASMSFVDEEGKTVKVEFIHRKPTVIDMEAYQKTLLKSSSIDAQRNILASIIVHPASADVIERVKEYPTVIATFVDERLTPFFGSKIESTSSAI